MTGPWQNPFVIPRPQANPFFLCGISLLLLYLLCDQGSSQIQALSYHHSWLAFRVLGPLHPLLGATWPQHSFDISMNSFTLSTTSPHLYCKWSYTSGFQQSAILSWGFCEECTFQAGVCGLPGICWFLYPNRYPQSRFCTRCPARTNMDPGPQAVLNEQEEREVKGPGGVA